MKNIIESYRKKTFHDKLNKFALSPLAAAIMLLLACLITVFDFQINGVAIFGYICIFMLLLCSDITVLLLPVLLTTVFACECYDSADKFLSFIIPEAIIIIISFSVHAVLYSHPFKPGKSFGGIAAVAVCVTLSGVFCISAEEYFKPASLYYTVFLGVGMLAIYCFLSSLSTEHSGYDKVKKLTQIFYVTGLFAAFCVIWHYIKNFGTFINKPGIINFQSSNNLSTFLMICLPFAFYYAVANSKLNIAGICFMFSSLLLTGSGGGLIMGSFLFLLCLIFAAIYDKKFRILWSVLSLSAVVSGIILSGFVLKKYGFYSISDVFYSSNSRIRLLHRSLSDFSSHPLFGVGLCYTGNTDIYMPRAGAMNWYHMMIPQIIGSMGIAGILGYGYQMIVRIKLVFAHLDIIGATLSMSYLGLFLMSQVNPGEFCPIPYALIGVILFMFIERREKCTFRQYIKKA